MFNGRRILRNVKPVAPPSPFFPHKNTYLFRCARETGEGIGVCPAVYGHVYMSVKSFFTAFLTVLKGEGFANPSQTLFLLLYNYSGWINK